MQSATLPANPAGVLVVEDDEGTARSLRTLLASRGYRVDVALSAPVALRKATEHTYELVVADCDLGEQDGAELVRGIRRLHPGLPVLVVSARDRQAVLVALEGLDHRDCLEKPVLAETLLAAVERHLRPAPR